jgi:dTDP-4-amino-4,6-dideoxyglucose
MTDLAGPVEGLRGTVRGELVSPLLPTLEEMEDDLREALSARRLSNHGPFVRRLEEAVARRLGWRCAVATSSGTLGLVVALRALGWRGEVVMPSFTFAATPHAAAWAGLEPVFADVDDTLCLDPGAVARAIGPRTAGVVPVDVFGVPALGRALADAIGSFPVLCDAAHSFGSVRDDAVRPRVAVHSLHATKAVAAGEGGVLVTDDDAVAERARRLVNFGFDGRGDCAEPGLNAKMPEISAILAWHHLARLDRTVASRLAWVEAYRRALDGVPGLGFQRVPEGVRANHEFFVVRVDEERFGRAREEVREALAAEGVATRAYFSPPAHRLACYARSATREPLPVTERASREALCLPLRPSEPPEVAGEIARRVRALYRPRPGNARAGRSRSA